MIIILKFIIANIYCALLIFCVNIKVLNSQSIYYTAHVKSSVPANSIPEYIFSFVYLIYLA